MFNIQQKFDTNIVTWQEAIDNINQSMLNKEEVKIKEPGHYVVHEAQRIWSVQKILERLRLKYAHLYMNMVVDTGTFGNHKDEMNVWYWQCEGRTKWIIDEKDECLLEPGDLIFIEAGTYHNIIPLTPRFGISMSNT